MMQSNILWKTAVTLILAAVLGAAAADDETGTWTANFAIGYQHWNAVGELDTEPLGTFDEGGWNVVGSVKRRWREVGHSNLLFGMDLGLMSNDSDIRAPGDLGEVAADVWFLTPSITWSVGGRRSKRLNLEAGAGLYWAEIKEFWNTGYGVAEGTEYFEEIAPGGYLGVSADFPVPYQEKAWAFNIAARVHYADFGKVEAFGRNLGDLDGPITTLQVGLTYDW
jgi:hypothetical protein